MIENVVFDLADVFLISFSVSLIFVILVVILYFYDKHGFSQVSSYLLSCIVLIISISVVGAVAGYAGGLSRTGVVGDVIPAALGLLGGLSVYLFGIQKTPTVVTPIVVVVFAVSLVAGFSAGAKNREQGETFDRVQAACFGLFMSPHTMEKSRLELAQKNHSAVCSAVFKETLSKITNTKK